MIHLSRQFARFGGSLLSPNKIKFTTQLKYSFAEKVFPLPNIADSITEGVIAEFTKKEGEWVDLDDTIANVETDKVTVEVKSPSAGVLIKLYAQAGDTVPVGKPLFGVDVDAAKPEGAGSKPAEKKEESKSADTSKPQ